MCVTATLFRDASMLALLRGPDNPSSGVFWKVERPDFHNDFFIPLLLRPAREPPEKRGPLIGSIIRIPIGEQVLAMSWSKSRGRWRF